MSVAGKGLKDWLVQRATAIALVAYLVILVSFWLSHPGFEFSQWQTFMMQPWMKIATLLALISVALHAWIGIWTVLTDYVHQTIIRYALEMIIIVALLGYVVWGFQILYGVQ